MPTMTGTVTIVQEGRFQMVDEGGAAHLFVLGPNAACEPAQLKPLARAQTKIRVTYQDAARLIAMQASRIEVL